MLISNLLIANSFFSFSFLCFFNTVFRNWYNAKLASHLNSFSASNIQFSCLLERQRDTQANWCLEKGDKRFSYLFLFLFLFFFHCLCGYSFWDHPHYTNKGCNTISKWVSCSIIRLFTKQSQALFIDLFIYLLIYYWNGLDVTIGKHKGEGGGAVKVHIDTTLQTLPLYFFFCFFPHPPNWLNCIVVL